MDISSIVASLAHRKQHPVSPARTVGIIGGGQLGMLLCQAARRLGVHTTVLTNESTGPAIHAADRVLTAPLHDPPALEELIDRSDVITFELEAVPGAALDRLREASGQGRVAVNPGIDVLALLKDKGLQKKWLMKQGFPTLPFLLIDHDTGADAIAHSGFSAPLVQKARQGGYDGKGVQILRDPSELDRLWPTPSLIEPALEACIEVGVVVARDAAGRLGAYPPVTMQFDPDLNAVSTVTSPGALATGLQERCRSIACAAVTALGTAGVFAVELFLTERGDVFINEISPRVHNSGHLTIDGFKHDQFEQHIRAVTGRELAPVVPRAPAAVMLNLLYTARMANAHTGAPYTMALDARGLTRLHWYGKREARPGRKMGHITALGTSPAVALERAHAGLAHLRGNGFRPPLGEQQAAAS